jgi:hypothetical protein
MLKLRSDAASSVITARASPSGVERVMTNCCPVGAITQTA